MHRGRCENGPAAYQDRIRHHQRQVRRLQKRGRNIFSQTFWCLQPTGHMEVKLIVSSFRPPGSHVRRDGGLIHQMTQAQDSLLSD